MKKIFSFLLFLGVVSPLEADVLESAIRGLSGTQASFVQRFTPKGFKHEQRERGTVIFGVPPRMRWTYGGAEARTFIFNGSTSWLYTPSEKQVVVQTLTPGELRAIPLSFLWNSGSSRDYVASESRSGGKTIVKLTPRSKAAALRDVRVTINAAKRIERLEYVDQGGNRTVFEFSGHKTVATSDNTFRFDAPAGVSVVRN